MTDGPQENGPQGQDIQNQDSNLDFNSGTGPEDTLKVDPAWQPLLDKLPTSLHNLVIPELQNHNKNVQKLVGQVHSRYEPFKRYAEQQIDPRVLDEGLQVYQALQADPVQFVNAVRQYYGHLFEPEQGQSQQQETDEEVEELPFSVSQDPDFRRYREMTENMAQAMLLQHQEQIAAQEDAELDRELTEAKQKYGDFDEEDVLMLAEFRDLSIDQAVQAWQQKRDSIIQNHRNPSANAPILMGPGGGSPSSQIPVGNLDSKARKDLVVQALLRARAQEG